MARPKRPPRVSVPLPPKARKTPPRPSMLAKKGVFASFEDTDMGWAGFADAVEGLGRGQIDVGFFSNHGPHRRKRKIPGQRKAGPSVIARAAMNQFGTNRIPARPFMTDGFDHVESDITLALRTILLNSTTQAEMKTSIRAAGEFLVEELRQVIKLWEFPKNAALTIKFKGFNDPLVWSGEMAFSPIVRYSLSGERPKIPDIDPTPKNSAVKTKKGRGGGSKGRRGGGGWIKSLMSALNAQGARTAALRAPKKSGSKKATRTKFSPRARFRIGGSGRRGR